MNGVRRLIDCKRTAGGRIGAVLHDQPHRLNSPRRIILDQGATRLQLFAKQGNLQKKEWSERLSYPRAIDNFYR